MRERNLEVFLDTTNTCNLRCVMCTFSDPRVAQLPKYVMPWELYEKIARQVFPSAEYVTLSCLAEPLMNRDFARYLRFAGTFSIPHLEFVTNATLLRDEHLEACVEARLWRLAISLDGSNAATYERVRRGASWSTFVANVERARDFFAGTSHRPILRFITTLVTDNFREAADVVRAALAWGAGEIELRETLSLPGIGLEERQLKGRGEELRDALLECRAICDAAGVAITILTENAPGLKIDLSSVPLCHALERRLAIAANGDAMPCMLWAREPLGNFRDMEFEQFWNGAVRQRLRDQFSREAPRLWCPECTICKNDPTDDDAYYRLIAKPKPQRTAAKPPEA